jgi:TRAP-type C4-dicarboxylate transport system permease small subunit
METFDKVLRFATEKMAIVAQVAIVVCVFFVVTDIILREVVGIPFPGVFEIVSLIAAVILSMGIGYLTFVGGHVAVGILVDRFRPRRQAIFDLANSVISLSFTILLTTAMVKFGIEKQIDGWTTGHLLIPKYPFIYLVAGALALTCLVLIRDTVRAVIMLKKGGQAWVGRW